MKKRIPYLLHKKKKKEKLVAITAYDYSFARIIDQCEVDIILVGDSLANVISGYESTLPVTMDEMIYHSKAVKRAVKKSFLIADLPFMSYHLNIEQAKYNAGRLMKEALVEGVKLEGDEAIIETIYQVVKAGIPVIGHIGFTPQAEHQIGGYIVQGKNDVNSSKLLKSAKAIEEAGAFAIVLETLDQKIAKIISESLSIPTIGIGAGPFTDGQILVCYDLLGISDNFNPKFLKKYLNLSDLIFKAVNQYSNEVRNGKFPTNKHSY